MDKAQVIAALKKNIVSILAGVLALVALGIMLFWVDPQREELKTQVEARAAKAGEIDTLLSRPRESINFSANGSRSEGATLSSFPTPAVIAEGRAVMDSVKQQASGVLQQAIDANRRVPLGFTPDQYEQAAAAWPLEGERNKLNRDRFARDYAAYINAANNFLDNSFPQNTLPYAARGTRPPTPEEIGNTLANLAARLTAEAPADAQGQPANPEALQQEIAERSANLATQLKYDRAREFLMYVEPNTTTSGFTVHPVAQKTNPTDNPTVEEIWNAQVGLWVQETVVANLRRANELALGELPSEQQNLLNGPVKHLLWVNVPTTFVDTSASPGTGGGTPGGMPGGMPSGIYGGYPGGGYPGMEGMDPLMMDPGLGGGMALPPPPQQAPTPRPGANPSQPSGGFGPAARGSGTGAPDEPAAPEVELPVDAGATIEPDYSTSPTGRGTHTPFYDVIRFDVSLRCDAARVPYVLAQLQSGALLTVTNVEMTMVDLATAAQEGYVYGEYPVAELDLECEMLLLRNWTVDLMPTSVKEALAAISDPTAGGGDTTGGAGGGYGGYGNYGAYGY